MKTEWISTDQRLPEVNQDTGSIKVLGWLAEPFRCCDAVPILEIGYHLVVYDEDGYWVEAETGHDIGLIIHWQPLPEPPQALTTPIQE